MFYSNEIKIQCLIYFFKYFSIYVKKICAGDVIIAVNGDSFINMSHEDAVRYLSSLRGSIRFDLQNTIEADIEAVCDMDSRYYDLYDVSFHKFPLKM
jgi:hypothetical protein